MPLNLLLKFNASYRNQQGREKVLLIHMHRAVRVSIDTELIMTSY